MQSEKKVLNFILRCVILACGLTIMAFGVAFSIKASLGTSPISSVPTVISMFTNLTVGNITIIMHCVFISIQILLLRKKYHLYQLLQLPVAFAFGYLTDLGIWAVRNINPAGYGEQWMICFVGIVLVAAGVYLEVKANVVPLAGEGVVLAACQVLPIRFGNMKVIFDISLVVTACILSFIFLHSLEGVREGTVAAAILVGQIVKLLNWLTKRIAEKK